MKKFYFSQGFIFLLFVLDRLVKNYLVLNPQFTGGFSMAGIISWQVQLNTQSAFSLPIPNLVMMALMAGALVLFGAVIVFTWQQKLFSLTFFWSLVTVGAFSNLLDRWRFGGVVDYWNFGGYSIFNLADVMITAGVICLLIVNFQPTLKK
jgi:signal peptidase II